MPLLKSPNNHAAMTTVIRGGVEFDMRLACRGVWLDCGEPEKPIAAGEAPKRQAPTAAGYQRPGRRENHSDGPGRFDRDDDADRKMKRRDLFDNFN